MNPLLLKSVALAVLFGVALGTGCNRPSPPPAALSVQEMPAALEKAFTKAKPEVKNLASQVVAAVQAQDYAKAFQAVQNLANQPGLTKNQGLVASRAALTVNDLLQAAETKGDKKAAQTLKNYRVDK